MPLPSHALWSKKCFSRYHNVLSKTLFIKQDATGEAQEIEISALRIEAISSLRSALCSDLSIPIQTEDRS
uniref:Uncharacterized protein n=1 Tax=Anguilla anguilla TaxID=7936 RepID=A0A0E9SUJ6_ANGAN